jgi:hypothetical protein
VYVRQWSKSSVCTGNFHEPANLYKEKEVKAKYFRIRRIRCNSSNRVAVHTMKYISDLARWPRAIATSLSFSSSSCWWLVSSLARAFLNTSSLKKRKRGAEVICHFCQSSFLLLQCTSAEVICHFCQSFFLFLQCISAKVICNFSQSFFLFLKCTSAKVIYNFCQYFFI